MYKTQNIQSCICSHHSLYIYDESSMSNIIVLEYTLIFCFMCIDHITWSATHQQSKFYLTIFICKYSNAWTTILLSGNNKTCDSSILVRLKKTSPHWAEEQPVCLSLFYQQPDHLFNQQALFLHWLKLTCWTHIQEHRRLTHTAYVIKGTQILCLF